MQKSLLHQVENTGDSDLVFPEMFKAERFQDFCFSEWLAHTPPELAWRICISTKRSSMRYQERRR